jgi:hypothetical protein
MFDFVRHVDFAHQTGTSHPAAVQQKASLIP